MAWRAALAKATRPVVAANARLYALANERSGRLLAALPRGRLPVTADGITTARSALVVPTLWLFSHGHTVAPAALVVINVTFDYVDGAVARWERADRRRALLEQARSATPQTPQARGLLMSAFQARLKDTWGAYYDAIADKAFAIPVWMVCFQQFGEEPLLQAALLSHVAIEAYSSYVRTKAYYNEPAPLRWANEAREAAKSTGEAATSAAAAQGPHASAPSPAPAPTLSSSVVAGIVGKTKQFISMLGTAMIMVPFTHSVGAALVVISVPFAVASVAQKSKAVRVYAELPQQPVSAETMEFIEQSKALGSTLLVGVRPAASATGAAPAAIAAAAHQVAAGAGAESVVATRASPAAATALPHLADLETFLRLHPSVDFVLPSEALPPRGSLADNAFLDLHKIDLVAVPSSHTFEAVETSPEDWRSGRIVPVRVDLS
jgi:phosphatidylglycerophosphate synthase